MPLDIESFGTEEKTFLSDSSKADKVEQDLEMARDMGMGVKLKWYYDDKNVVTDCEVELGEEDDFQRPTNYLSDNED